MMGWEWFGGGIVMILIGLLIFILFWGGIIVLIVWAVRQFTGPRSATYPRTPAPPTNTPLEIARERYAKGEITKEQYEQLKKDLET